MVFVRQVDGESGTFACAGLDGALQAGDELFDLPEADPAAVGFGGFQRSEEGVG